jgi:tRNA pseudouridine32 synthase/23S rRNA pseudouridine746 synthase
LIDVLYSDDDLLFIDKPAGLLSVPGKTEPDCVERRLREQFPEALTVHRLDMATSGVMIFARNKPAQRHIGLQFERRHLAKSYIAIVDGVIIEDTGHIDLPLRADWPNRPLQMVCFEEGRASQTDWRVLERYEDRTRLELTPLTGRSHQLRVHLKAIGHTILGDEFYAAGDVLAASDRLLLHAHTLSLFKPTGGERVTITSPLPF